MHTTHLTRFGILSIATVTLLMATQTFAQRSAVLSSSRSSSDSSVSSTKKEVSVTTDAPKGALENAKISELPYCGNSKVDQMLVWDAKAKKWGCKALTSLMPPKCDTKDSVLRYDGSAWKCEVIPGILVAHTATFDDFNGKNTCDTQGTWGGATCEITSNGMGAKLKCPTNTLQINVNALNGYQVGGTYPLFGGEYHAFCYSKPINVIK